MHFVQVCKHMHTYTYIHTYSVHTYRHTYAWTHRIHTQHMHTHTRIHTHTHTHTHTHAHNIVQCILLFELIKLHFGCNINVIWYTISGYYGTSTNRSCLVYTTFSNRILIYHSIELLSMLPSTLLSAMTEEVSHINNITVLKISS